MFTINEIKAAHSKVRSGADFPAYIQQLKSLGVRNYVCPVSTGDIKYFSGDGQAVSTGPKFDPQSISPVVDTATFSAQLKLHQGGGSSFPEFIAICAKTGVDRWEVNIETMTCTYFDGSGTVVLIEEIPG